MMAYSMARLLMTGKEPGKARHTGHTWVFGGLPNQSAEQEQNILDRVRSST